MPSKSSSMAIGVPYLAWSEVNVDGPVTRITLDRPDRRNTLSLELMREFVHALDGLDDTCAVVVVEAHGPAFSAGHDLARDDRHVTTPSTPSCSPRAPR